MDFQQSCRVELKKLGLPRHHSVKMLKLVRLWWIYTHGKFRY